MKNKILLRIAAFPFLLSFLCIGFTPHALAAEDGSSSTAIPVQFTHAVDSAKAHTNDVVFAKTMQEVSLPNGQTIPKGSRVIGHVIDIQAFTVDPTPYATQKPSFLSIQFDRIEEGRKRTPIKVSLRALASAFSSRMAETPQSENWETSTTLAQIGGDHFSPMEKEVFNTDGDIVGYNRRQGVFAQLVSSEYVSRYGSFPCAAIPREQSVGIFSASACGLYGFDPQTYIVENGSTTRGTFRLEARHYSVEIEEGSTALLLMREE